MLGGTVGHGYARPRVIRGTRVKPLPLLPSGPGGVCSRPLHEARSLTTSYASRSVPTARKRREAWCAERSLFRPARRNREQIVGQILIEAHGFRKNLINLFTIALACDLLRPSDPLIVAIPVEAGDFFIAVLGFRIQAREGLLHGKLGGLVKVHANRGVPGVYDVYDVHRHAIDHVGSYKFEVHTWLVQALAENVEDVVERGFAVALKILDGNRLGAAVGDVSTTVLAQHNRRIFVLSERLTLAHAQFMSAFGGIDGEIAGIDFRNRES